MQIQVVLATNHVHTSGSIWEALGVDESNHIMILQVDELLFATAIHVLVLHVLGLACYCRPLAKSAGSSLCSLQRWRPVVIWRQGGEGIHAIQFGEANIVDEGLCSQPRVSALRDKERLS